MSISGSRQDTTTTSAANTPPGAIAPEEHAAPAWLKPVIVAVVVMGMLIIAGLVLLVYGITNNMGSLADKSRGVLKVEYPAAATPLISSLTSPTSQAALGADGMLLLAFDEAGETVLLIIDTNTGVLHRRVVLQAAENYAVSPQ